MSPRATLYCGDALDVLSRLPDGAARCCITSPPYFGLRDYGVPGQLGLERTPEEYVARLVEVFREVRRVLADDGTLWVVLGDSYNAAPKGSDAGWDKRGLTSPRGRERTAQIAQRASIGGKGLVPGLKAKDLIGVPWMVAFGLRADGWWLRSAIIWAKPNGMPGSQEDRPTSSYEMIFLLSKAAHYFSDFDAIKTPPRESSLVRLAQDVQAQAGSHRANGGGKTNGPMKAVAGRRDKQRGHSRTHAGFNARWDAMSREEQRDAPAMMRDVWFIAPQPYQGAHFAAFPEELARRCILSGSAPGDTVLDPFAGTGTVGQVATGNGRSAVLIELNPAYRPLIEERVGRLLLECAPESAA